MDLKYFILLFILRKVSSDDQDQLYLVKSVRTDYLSNFEGYAYVTVIRFNIPGDTQFASFRFQAEQTRFSLFSCDGDEIILYMKHGSVPVVNADESKVPSEFINASHTKLMYLEFSSDKQYHYINITTPAPGSYYAAAFHPYVHPDKEAITQAGLSKVCRTYVDASLFIKKSYVVGIGMSGVSIDITLGYNETQTYKFYIPGGSNRLVIALQDVEFCKGCTELTARLYSEISEFSDQGGIMSISSSTYKKEPLYYRLSTIDNTWHYIQFNFTYKNVKNSENLGKLKLKIKSFSTADKKTAIERYTEILKMKNLTGLFANPSYNYLINDVMATRLLHKEYELVRSGKAETFAFNFDVHPQKDGTVPISVNLTSEDYTTLKFHLEDAVDTGGTINIIIAFTPRITKNGKSIVRTPEPSNHIIVACVRNNLVQIPTWPDKCIENNVEIDAPLILNETMTNATAMLPFPEAGVWYVTLKLYCAECTPCKCPRECVESYQSCVGDCENNCTAADCGNCTSACRAAHLEKGKCLKNCDCDGACRRGPTTCNSSILFDIASYPCMPEKCGRNGRCTLVVSEGFVYSSCICANKYKGWDCGDDTNATPYGMLVLEMFLLIVSNVGFVPAAYFAYRRRYFVEAIVYFSTFLFSSLYHACDAGENVMNFCIVPLGVLQFSDFFSGLLSIWVTLIAMAYLPQPFVAIAHMSGCILLAFGTTFNKTSIWVFTIPTVIGLGIMVGNWIYLSRKNKCWFPSKKYLKYYLPTGLTVVLVGLLTYALFQTQSNYKYLHSLWHFLMAMGVICLLPQEKVFLPDTMHTNMELSTNHSD